jgi:glyoxylase-like metal-dependent hydrolase (beta-lactamase superfamily II)
MLEIPFPQGWFPPDAPSATLCYLVRQGQGWLLVDCGLKHHSCLDSLLQQLRALNVSPRDIKWLLITHFHPDHFGLASELKALSDARIIMHRLDWEVLQFILNAARGSVSETFEQWVTSVGVLPKELEGYNRAFEFGTALFPVDAEPDSLLDGEDERVGDSGLRAILTPGHTPGHVCVYDEKNRLLFSGDHVLMEVTSHISPAILGNDDQLDLYLQSLKKVAALDVRMVLPAHENPFSNLAQRVGELLEHHEERLQQVLAPIRSRPLSARDIAARVEWVVGFWEQMDSVNRLLAILETLAHLRVLQERGLVVTEEKHGVNLYTAAKQDQPTSIV